MIHFDAPKDKASIIKVIGVGGGGGNAVNHMFGQGIEGVDFILCNTDEQALNNSPIPNKITIGKNITEGLGAGSKPEVGRNAAIEETDLIREALAHNTKMVFITAGMGGGTGTGAAPIIAEIAKSLDILTIAIVTIPFHFEGRKRSLAAAEGIKKLKEHVDAIIVIDNEKIIELFGDLTIDNAFSHADNILTIGAKGIAELISVHRKLNLDFEDVKTVMSNSGVALMGSGIASGENRAIAAAKMAINSPLLDESDILNSKRALLNIAYSSQHQAGIMELGEITNYLKDQLGDEADLIFGYGIDDNLEDNISVTLIATGFRTKEERAKEGSKRTLTLQDESTPRSRSQLKQQANDPLKHKPDIKHSHTPDLFSNLNPEPMAPKPSPAKPAPEAPTPPQAPAPPSDFHSESDEAGGITMTFSQPKPDTPSYNPPQMDSHTDAQGSSAFSCVESKAETNSPQAAHIPFEIEAPGAEPAQPTAEQPQSAAPSNPEAYTPHTTVAEQPAPRAEALQQPTLVEKKPSAPEATPPAQMQIQAKSTSQKLEGNLEERIRMLQSFSCGTHNSTAEQDTVASNTQEAPSYQVKSKDGKISIEHTPNGYINKDAD